MAHIQMADWAVTPEKIEEAVRRLVAASNPLQVILFGSRARGDFRAESDVDLAVIVDDEAEEARKNVAYAALRGLRMEVSLIVASEAKYELHRPWLNSVFHYIAREGIVLYDRKHPESSCADALQVGVGRRVDSSLTAA